MIRCGGCGRETDPEGLEAGYKYLCARCYHIQVAGPQPERTLGPAAFLVIAAVCLAVVALTGLTLCILYLVGTGDFTWFMVLGLLMLVVAGVPAALLSRRKRNVSLLTASLYLPLGVWAYLWHLAPGVGWEYSRITAWSGYIFFLIGAVAVIYFVRDLRVLPRL